MQLGLHYSHRHKPNEAKAFYWFKKAAAQGNMKAALQVANSYNSGVGVPITPKKAAQWYKKVLYDLPAGNQDTSIRVTVADALAGIYSPANKGSGPKNRSKAIHWTRKAAKYGDLLNEVRMVHLYECGSWGGNCIRNHVYETVNNIKSTPETSYTKAIHWIHTILRQKSFYFYAPKHLLLKQYPSDNSSEWPKRSRSLLEFRFSLAQYFLGMDYYIGVGVKQNSEKALHWLRKAAKGRLFHSTIEKTIQHIKRG